MCDKNGNITYAQLCAFMRQHHATPFVLYLKYSGRDKLVHTVICQFLTTNYIYLASGTRAIYIYIYIFFFNGNMVFISERSERWFGRLQPKDTSSVPIFFAI